MKLLLTFVVNGEDIPIEVEEHERLHAAVSLALAKSGNVGRPPEEWELRYEDGTLIEDLTKPVNEYGFTPGVHLYLTLKVGAGGNAPRSAG